VVVIVIILNISILFGTAMATAAFRLTLKDFGVCWLIPGEESYVGRRKLVTWTLYRDRPWVALVSFQVRSRSSRETILRELHIACLEKCLVFTR
jgi:hypothetical protein